MASPYRIKLISQGPVSDTDYVENIREAAKHGFPEITEQQPFHDRSLAIVGGGPSVVDYLDEIAQCDEVWGVNATANWLIERGIDATFVSVDADAVIAKMIGKATRGIVDAGCHPSVFSVLKDIRVFYTREHPSAVWGGCTTASRVPLLAIRLGYKDIRYFGCDGSFEGRTHIDRDESRSDYVIVRAGGVDYTTTPDYLLQTESLATMIRECAPVFKCRSGGLLKAMIEHFDTWEWAAVSESYRDRLREYNGDLTMFGKDYKGATCSQ